MRRDDRGNETRARSNLRAFEGRRIDAGFWLLDGLAEMRVNCTGRTGGLLLAGAERVPWRRCRHRRAVVRAGGVDEVEFAALVRKAQAMQRRLAGEPRSPRVLQRSGAEPQAKTLLSPWRLEGGFPTRYIVSGI